MLPILSKLKQPEKVGFRAVIVSPTRELAQQIYRELRKLSKGKEFRICVLTKANANENSFSSTTRFDILVTTPMRLVHLLRNESLKLDSVQHLVLDEADKLLDMGFMEQVDEIIAACTNQAVQRSLWSATMSPIVEDLARTFLRDPVHLTIGTRDAATTTIKQRLEFVVSAVDFVDQQHRRHRPTVAHILQDRPVDQVCLGVELVCCHAGAAGLGEPDRQQLPLVVPVVERLARGQTFIALQPDQLRIQHFGKGFGRGGLADAGLTFQQQRPAQLHRQVNRRRGAGVQQVVILVEQPGHVAGAAQRHGTVASSRW